MEELKKKISELLKDDNSKKFPQKFTKHRNHYFNDDEIKIMDDIGRNELRQICYLIKMEQNSKPKCKFCGDDSVFLNWIDGYRDICNSRTCRNEKRKLTNLEKYGFENATQSDKIKEKTKKTNLEKYGVEYTAQSTEIREKIKKTNLNRYGFKIASQSVEVKEKTKRSNLEKYGVEYTTQLKSTKEKIKKTNIERYGADNVFKSEYIKNKIRETNLAKYNAEIPSQSEHIKEKIKNSLKLNSIKKYNGLHFNQVNFKNIEMFNTEYITNNFITQNGNVKIKELQTFFNMSRNAVYTKLRTIGVEYTKSNTSLAEEEICDILKPYSFINTRSIIKPYEIDLYSEDLKMGIEYDGLIYHSFGISEYTKFNNTIENPNYHVMKTNLCEAQNIQLYHIFENEWLDKRKRDVWISLLNSKIGKTTKVYASDCVLNEINDDVYYDFLEINHLQGYVNSKIKIGLFHNKELIYVMSLKELTDKNEYELMRLCSKVNYTVVGAMNKILKHFEETFKPRTIIIYANRRWCQGLAYEKLGFDFVKNTEPNYFYFKLKDLTLFPSEEVNTSNFKHNLNVFDKKLTETENMFNNGYRKIYDCGNKVYIKKY